MNILEQEDLIKGLDDRRLQEEAKRPTGQVPQFLVVSEIQRRTDMRKKYQDPSQQQPQGTVADQITQAGIASVQPPQMMQGQPMPMQGQPMPMQAYGGGMTPFMRKYAGGGVVQMQSGRRIMRPDITADGYVPANTSYLEEIERRRLEEEAARQFPNAIIEDSESANRDSATVGDPTADGYINPVSIDLARQVSNYASDDNVIDYTRSENPQYRPPEVISLVQDATSLRREKSSKEDASSDGTFSQIMSALNPFQSSGGRTASNMEGALVDSTLTRNRSFNEPLLTNPSTGRPLFGIESEKYLGLSPDQQRELDRQETVDSYKKVPRVDVPEGFIDIDGALRPIDSFTALSGSGLRAIQNKKEQDRIRALIAATSQTGPAFIEPEVEPEVGAEVSGDVVVKSAEETIKRARDKSSQPDIDAKVKQNRMASGASGLGNLFGLEGDKKQAFSMALMALGAGIAKGDTAGGLKDAGLAMNAISEQNLDREDKRLDRLGKAEDRTLRRLDIKDARAERDLIRAETKADRERRDQQQASYRLQTLMAAYIKERGSVDTQEQQIEYENKLRRGLKLPVLELNTGADVGLTGGNLSSSAGGNMSYSKETGLKK